MKLPIEIKIKDIVITCPVFIKYYVKYCNLLDLKIESANSVKLYLKDVVIHFNNRDHINEYYLLEILKDSIDTSKINPFEALKNKAYSEKLGLISSNGGEFWFLYNNGITYNSALPLLENFDKYLDENFHNK